MSSTRHLVSPKLPTALAKETYVDLPGYDIRLAFVNSVHVVPTKIDVLKFEEALSGVLQLYPPAAGRLRCTDGRWSVELTNTPIPVDIDYKLDMTSDQLLEGDWVIQDDLSLLLSQQPIEDNSINGNAPLLRLKLTFFNHETCIGVSCNHSLGDGVVMIRFMNTLSQFYQGLDPVFAAPTFKKYHFPTPSRSMVTEMSSRMPFYPMRKFSEPVNADSRKDVAYMGWRIDDHDLEVLCSALAHDKKDKKPLSKQDCLTAYLVAVLNHNRVYPMQQVSALCSYRHISAPFINGNATSNLFLVITTKVPADMAGIITAVPDARKQCQEPSSIYVLETVQSSVMLEAANAQKLFSFMRDYSDELFVNSNIALDWLSAHFGCPDGTRFHTDGVYKHYMRCYRSNPRKGEDGVWQARQSIDISMGVPAELKSRILETLARGVEYMLDNSVANPTSPSHTRLPKVVASTRPGLEHVQEGSILCITRVSFHVEETGGFFPVTRQLIAPT